LQRRIGILSEELFDKTEFEQESSGELFDKLSKEDKKISPDVHPDKNGRGETGKIVFRRMQGINFRLQGVSSARTPLFAVSVIIIDVVSYIYIYIYIYIYKRQYIYIYIYIYIVNV
jgi:hypothetical protein